MKSLIVASLLSVVLGVASARAQVVLDSNPAGLNTDNAADNMASAYPKINQNFAVLNGKLPAMAASRFGNIASGVYVPNTFNSSFKQVSFRAPHIAYNAGSPVTQAQIALPCYYSPVSNVSAETGLGAPTTWTASIEYPSGTYNVATFGGSASGACTDNTVFLSDAITLSTPIPDGARFWVNGHSVNAIGVVLHNGAGFDVNNGGAAIYAASVTDYTQTPGIVDQNAAWLTDLGVLTNTKQRGFVLIGDSRTAGYGSGSFQDAFNANGPDLGNLGRSIGRFAPYINEGVPSSTVTAWNASHANQLQLAGYASDAIIEMAINDVFRGDSAATVQASINTLRSYLPATMPVSLTTSEPSSTNTALSVTSLVANGNGLSLTVASATTASRMQIGETITVAGATPTTDNGPCTITSISGAVVNCVSSVATGTATATGTITVTDGFQSPYLQSTAATNAVRVAVNDWKRGLSLSLAGFSHIIEIADVVEAGRNSGKWNNGSQFAVPGASFFAETNDGVHETQQAYVLIQRSGVVSPAALN